MEYSFRHSKNSAATSVFLDDYRLILRKGSAEEFIPYANIVAVRISLSKGVYRTHIYPDGRKPILIPSKSVSDQGILLDQAGGYSLLVRVLHHHLKEKSRTVFRSGSDPEQLLLWIGGAATFSFLVSIALHYYGFRIVHPYLQALAFSALAAIMVVAISAHRLPRNYHPAKIPLRFLP